MDESIAGAPAIRFSPGFERPTSRTSSSAAWLAASRCLEQKPDPTLRLVEHDTTYRRGVSINDVEGLHRVIG